MEKVVTTLKEKIFYAFGNMDANEALAKNKSRYGRYNEAVKVIDPRYE